MWLCDDISEVSDLAALLEVRGIDRPVTLCGLSMGGYVAWSFFRRHRRRLRALVLCDTRAAADTLDAIQGRMKMAKLVLEHGPKVVADAMLPNLFSASTLQQRPWVVERVREMIAHSHREGVAAALGGMAARSDAVELLPSIDVPTLVLVGAEDALTTPAEMRTVAEGVPGAEYSEISDAGHMAPLESPEEFNAVLERFLRSLPAL